MMNRHLHCCFVVILIGIVTTSASCGPAIKQSWHAKFNWKAEEYFSDGKVIELCQAIEANDLEAMKKVIEGGADVNAKGRGNMTPLLWAFPDNKIERFTLLLEKGADPNVIVDSDFNTQNRGIQPGDSVTQMAAKSVFLEHFKAVMNHGGDPNLVNPRTGDTLLFELINSGRGDRVRLLVDSGADVNKKNKDGIPPVVRAVSAFGQFDVAMFLLDRGADPGAYMEEQNMKLVHMMLVNKSGLATLSPKQRADYYELEKRLKEMGESFEEAEADIKRWDSWAANPPAQIRRLREAEIAARKEKERKAKEKEQ